jgi:hypothetical protein
VEQRSERITVDTGRYRITGLVRLPRDGYRSRLTDYLNAGERAFLALTDVEIVSLDDGRAPEHRDFLALAMSQIVFVVTVEELGAAD